jgi:hypothetical protein
MTMYCEGCFADGPWPAELEGLCDDCHQAEQDKLGPPSRSELLAASPTEFPRFEDGRTVWACCVSGVGPDCLHKIAA